MAPTARDSIVNVRPMGQPDQGLVQSHGGMLISVHGDNKARAVDFAWRASVSVGFVVVIVRYK